MFCICGGGSRDNHSEACWEQELRHLYPKMTPSQLDEAVAEAMLGPDDDG